MSSSNLKHWLSRGELDKLENVVLEGRGARLLGEQSPDLRTRVFLKGLPNYLTKISQIHDAVTRGSLPEVQRLVDSEPKKKLVIAKDPAGTPLIHKSVYYDHQDVLEWILNNYPSTVDQKDREGRTALHYCAACRDPEVAWDVLIEAGCDASICDKRGNPAAYYLQHGSEIELPDPERMTRRLRHRETFKWTGSLDFKPSNIRIWIHNRDIGKLQHVLWEGHGSKLRCETSNNVRVKRFLEAVPFIMGTIKDIHTATIKNDIDTLRKKVQEPVTPIILSSKDSNGLNVLHKAAGLGYVEIAREILDCYPAIVNAQDNDGKTPLHYAAVCRDGGVMYDLLVEHGADESKIDHRSKTAAFYKNRPADVDLTSLVMVPEAPRVSGSNYPRHWDWRIIDPSHPVPRMKRTSNNADDDSAFGSAESAKLTEDIVTPEIENVEEEQNGTEEAELEPEPEAEAEGDGEAEGEAEVEAEAEPEGGVEDEAEPEGESAEAEAEDGGEPEPEAGAETEEPENGEAEAEVPQTPDETNNEPADNPEETEANADEEGEADEADNNNNEEIEAEPGAEETEAGADEGSEEAAAETEAGTEEAEAGTEEGTEEAEGGQEAEDEAEAEEGAEEPEAEAEAEGVQITEIEAEGEAEGVQITEVEAEGEEGAEEAEAEAEEGAEETEAEQAEAEAAEGTDKETGELQNAPENDGQTEELEEEKEEADSGVGNTPDDEEQVLVGEPAPDDEEEEEEEAPQSAEQPVEQEEQEEEGEREAEEEREEDDGMAMDEETNELLENGTMEQLAALVLTGEGHRLVGRHSSNPELQAFIDNVPAYMAKIRSVHNAAREGNLRDLQISLDRRKFAIAKDASSPHGATPLHVAVIFGHTPIVRYLAGRFPETAHALDLDGRTPLHYAATLADNGHYYNLLLHLGANPLVQDNFGQKADYYKHNQDDLSHKQLLRDFGAPDTLADEMLEDKVPGGDKSSARRDVSEPETLATLERCFRLLTSGVGGGGGGGGGTARRRSSVPAAAASSATGSSGGAASSTAGTLLGRCLRRSVFEAIKHRVTCMDHNLFDVIWPALKKFSNTYASNSSLEEGNIIVRERRLSVASYDEDFTGNVVVPDYESYVVFAELLDPLIRDLHCVSTSGELPDQPSTRFYHDDDEERPTSNPREQLVLDTVKYLETRDLDPSGKYILAGVIECTRNLANHQLPLTMRIRDLEDSERIVTGVLIGPELSDILAEGSSEDEPGTYYTLSEIMDPFNEVRQRLAASGLLLPITESENTDERRLHGKHWPYGRGVYVTAAHDLAIWVNVQDHVRVICCTAEERPSLVGRAYLRLAQLMTAIERLLPFRRDPKLGFLTSRPSALGNTLRFDLVVKLVGLARKPEDLKHLCLVRGLRIHPTLRRDTVRLGNQNSLSTGELQTYYDFERVVHNVLSLEKELALNNSVKIANVIANIFKRRRLSGSGRPRP